MGGEGGMPLFFFFFFFKQLKEGRSHRRASLQGLKDFGRRPERPGSQSKHHLTGYTPELTDSDDVSTLTTKNYMIPKNVFTSLQTVYLFIP